MQEAWKRNEEKGEEEDLTVTSHRDFDEPNVSGDDEISVETTHEDPRDTLAELGEDVASSPARRGHDSESSTHTG